MNLLVVLAMFFVDPVEADDLRETAPYDLSPIGAVEHLAASRLAAVVYPVRTSDLLAIAHHESRYTSTAVTHEYACTRYVKRRCVARAWIGDSCGVGTPLWRYGRRCDAWELTTLGGYLAAGMHLAEWARIFHGDRLRALGGYSGFAMDTQQPGARAWQRFDQRASRIRTAIKEAR